MFIDEAFNADKLIEFLGALIEDAGKKVFLILDNLRVHHSKPVKACVETRQDKIPAWMQESDGVRRSPRQGRSAFSAG